MIEDKVASQSLYTRRGTVMDIHEILRYLPHRYPFLLVDRILDLVPSESILGLKNVSIGDPFFTGHFPVRPVMPGVLIIEALAQAAAILAYRSTDWDPTESLFYLASVDNTRFRQVVTPGDQLLLHITVQRKRSNVWRFMGVATVDGKEVCSTDMTSMEGKIK